MIKTLDQSAANAHILDDVAKLGMVETYKRVKAAYADKATFTST